ncbi:MAG TPA: pentapeptide repeat-containing protein, partial [Verrucomicrobiae bacterium]|nr:pentapeptide repeat-containing protein [Verrucomicrobiae bacterium]
DADLSGAVLSGAVLRDADLRGAVLSGAVLRDADLSDAVLSDADLSGAVLRDADLSGAVLSGAVLPYIPKIDDLDGKILSAINTDGCSLNMRDWHTCETTHCRAGWAIHLSGAVGKTLESIYGPSVAGAFIYATCYPGMKIPNFTASNDEALADIKARAALATKTETAAVSK